MAEIKSQATTEVLTEMNRMPLFMTNLDETDGEGGENIALEALKAMAYEGTRAEIAENFRQQGNECARAKQWTDAKEFYDKAVAALKGPQNNPDPDASGPDVIEVELDEAEEAKKEKATEEACYVNRALCNLEKSKCLICVTDHLFVWLGEQGTPFAIADLCRKLPLMHPRLCTNPPPQPFQCQGLLPVRYCLPSA